MVAYNIGGALLPTRRLMLEYGRFNRAFPMRMVAHHACLDNPMVEAVMNFSVLLTGPFVSVRHRCHSGSAMEVQYDLMTFGIPGQMLPVYSSSSEIDLSWHNDFLKQRWIQETSNPASYKLLQTDSHGPSQTAQLERTPSVEGCIDPSTSWHWFELSDGGSSPVQTVVVPCKLDVCYGRGKGLMRHPGNARLRKMVEMRRERYEEAATKGEKSDIIREVVVACLNSGGRFLKQEVRGQAWVAVGYKEACVKVSHNFRNLKRGTVPSWKKPTTQS